MTNKEPAKKLQEALEGIDDSLVSRQIAWSLGVPKTVDEASYNSWLNVGRALYKDNIGAYEEIVAEVESHREQRKTARLLSDERARPIFSNLQSLYLI